MTDYETPNENTYTIYTKSGCTYCTKAKKLLVNENIQLIDCDDYLLDDKESFLNFIHNITNNPNCNTFPIIFHNKKYVGGYIELESYYQIENSFNKTNDDF